MDENEKELAAQQAFRKKLEQMRKDQPYMFSSVILDGASQATSVLNFYIEKIGEARVIRQLPSA